MEILCEKCGEYCVVDGDFPKVFAWCDLCGDYAETDTDLTREVMEQMIDVADQIRKFGGMDL